MTEELNRELLLYGGGGFFVSLLILFIFLFISIGLTLKKAGKSFWHTFLPIYNQIQLLKIANCSLWYLLFFLIPVVNIVFAFRYSIKLSKAFDGSVLLGILLFLIPFLGYPILGFGPYQYVKVDDEND